VATRFNRNNGLKYWIRHLLAHVLSRNLISPREGAQTSIFLASSSEVKDVTGTYFYKKKPVENIRREDYGEMAQRLWQLTEELIA
jgi:hypothetical protein